MRSDNTSVNSTIAMNTNPLLQHYQQNTGVDLGTPIDSSRASLTSLPLDNVPHSFQTPILIGTKLDANLPIVANHQAFPQPATSSAQTSGDLGPNSASHAQAGIHGAPPNGGLYGLRPDIFVPSTKLTHNQSLDTSIPPSHSRTVPETSAIMQPAQQYLVSKNNAATKRVFKVIVIGDPNVGKTCLSFRYCNGRFPEKTEATIGVDFRERGLEIDGDLIRVQIWDTAGQERFRQSMTAHYYRNVHAIVFVYDVTKPATFNNLVHWITECRRHHVDFGHVPAILIGNKCDCGPEEIAVGTNDAQKFADSQNMPLFETSAKSDSEADHVESIFMTLVHKLKESKLMTVGGLPGVGDSQTGETIKPGEDGNGGEGWMGESSMCGC